MSAPNAAPVATAAGPARRHRRLAVVAAALIGVAAACVPPATSPPVTGTLEEPFLQGAGVHVPTTRTVCSDHDADVHLTGTVIGTTQVVTDPYEWGRWTFAVTGGTTTSGQWFNGGYTGVSPSDPHLLGHLAAGDCATVRLDGWYYVIAFTLTW